MSTGFLLRAYRIYTYHAKMKNVTVKDVMQALRTHVSKVYFLELFQTVRLFHRCDSPPLKRIDLAIIFKAYHQANQGDIQFIVSYQVFSNITQKQGVYYPETMNSRNHKTNNHKCHCHDLHPTPITIFLPSRLN